VYEQNTGNLFIHHDISLPSPPLCLAHGDINTEGTSGNYCAVGMFTPGIEVWNLDVLDALEPICVLGGEDYSVNEVNKKKKKKKSHDQQPLLVEGSHTDAVMSLSWNSCHRNVIASGSADKTIKLWNITDPYRPVSTLTHHSDKVQSVLWHPSDGTLLATGSYDKTVALVDARCCASNGYNHKKVKVKADCESMAWDPYRPENLTVALEDGTVLCWDVRKFSDKAGPLWSFVAHEFGGVSDVCYNRYVL
jgi:periodic tryptophan protein 1